MNAYPVTIRFAPKGFCFSFPDIVDFGVTVQVDNLSTAIQKTEVELEEHLAEFIRQGKQLPTPSPLELIKSMFSHCDYIAALHPDISEAASLAFNQDTKSPAQESVLRF